MKKALLFDPYLDTLGGGERYFLTFAKSLITYGYTVEIAWGDKNILTKAKDRFGLDFSKIKCNKKAFKLFSGKSSIIDRYVLTTPYDLIFWVSDGSLPLLFSKNNLVHFQVPFTKLGGNKFFNLVKYQFINHLVYNSEFTRKIIEKSLPKDRGFVLYPPIDVESFKPVKKENLILSVARFDSPSHSKRQDILIRAFKKFYPKNKNYKLILTGGLRGNENILDKYTHLAKGLPVEINTNPNFDELSNLYSKSKFFWHAAGFGVDENINPEKVEHFGMTTVEAMASGCVPIVIAKGGQKEIITKGTGVLVDSIDSLSTQTEKLAGNKELLLSFQESTQKRSLEYSNQVFHQKINNLL